MAKKEWIDWLKCNVLEIIILILVIVLLVKAFSVPAVEKVSEIPIVITEEPTVLDEIPAGAGEPLTGEIPTEKIVVDEEIPTN